jgi:hypothetical protein
LGRNADKEQEPPPFEEDVVPPPPHPMTSAEGMARQTARREISLLVLMILELLSAD